MKERLQELYDKDRNYTLSYDQTVQPYHTVIAELILKYSEGRATQLLEFGCGVGNTLSEIDRIGLGMKYVAVDIDPRCLDITASRVNLEKKIKFEGLSDLSTLEAGSFDFLVVSHTLQYDPNPTSTMLCLLDKLSVNGILIFVTPNSFTLPILFSNAIGRRYSEGIFSWDRVYARNYLTSVLGMEVVEWKSDYFPIPLMSRFQFVRPVSALLGRLFPRMSFSVISVARRTSI